MILFLDKSSLRKKLISLLSEVRRASLSVLLFFGLSRLTEFSNGIILCKEFCLVISKLTSSLTNCRILPLKDFAFT